MFLDI